MAGIVQMVVAHDAFEIYASSNAYHCGFMILSKTELVIDARDLLGVNDFFRPHGRGSYYE